MAIKNQRVILHCDMNNCFASIEMKLNPELRGKPIAVCGSKEERHGIVLAKSEEAKKYGVKTAEAIWQAQKKCPDLIIVPPHYEEYRKHSLAAKQIYMQYTDLVEPFGLDECWLDVTGSQLLFGTGTEIAYTIKEQMKRKLGITVSVGVSFNKVFAKLGSDLKKPDAVTVIPKVGFHHMIFPLPVSDLIGVGRHTAEKLQNYGIYTIGDLAQSNQKWMEKRFGKMGIQIWEYANGLDRSPVLPADYVSPVKSIGRGMTAPKDLYGQEQVWGLLYRLADEVSFHLRSQKLVACGLQLVVRNDCLMDRQTQKTYLNPVRDAREIAECARELFESIYRYDLPVRALTIRAISLVDEHEPVQLLMGEDVRKKDKHDKLEQTAFALRQRFGRDAVTAATLTHADEHKT